MSDDRTNDLVDGDLADEIELVSDLVVAASTSTRHFTPDEVDALLGIDDEASPEAGEPRQSGESKGSETPTSGLEGED